MSIDEQLRKLCCLALHPSEAERRQEAATLPRPAAAKPKGPKPVEHQQVAARKRQNAAVLAAAIDGKQQLLAQAGPAAGAGAAKGAGAAQGSARVDRGPLGTMQFRKVSKCNRLGQLFGGAKMLNDFPFASRQAQSLQHLAIIYLFTNLKLYYIAKHRLFHRFTHPSNQPCSSQYLWYTFSTLALVGARVNYFAKFPIWISSKLLGFLFVFAMAATRTETIRQAKQRGVTESQQWATNHLAWYLSKCPPPGLTT